MASENENPPKEARERTCAVREAYAERGRVRVYRNECRALEGERVLGEIALAGRAIGGHDP